ncbi:GtrA family protein [Phyllobacterium sp. SYP-B3895]|uniref:GtrA family protein n=1 Tax=Phyllobacterium sp. SYP-B3895 TaxID=2663240 RepID=UPI001299FD75|nr:GtrA family protein [Phyllobacterium sp. SYP-B3895]
MTELLAILARFGIVGIAATLIYLAVSNLLIASGHVAPAPASLLGYLAGMITSFFGQSRFTFRVGETDWRHLFKFGLLSVVGLAVSYWSVAGAVMLGFHATVGTVAASILVPIVSFILMKLWVFA